MNYARIKFPDIANGAGARVSLFVSGCPHHCKGCFNIETWDYNYGYPFTEDTEKRILDLLSLPYIQGLSLLGGEPFDPRNEPILAKFVRKARDIFSNKDVWCWTGYLFEELANSDLLREIDILVDGPFVESEKSIGLQYRGSRNQRVIKVRESLNEGRLIFLDIHDR